MSEERSFKDSMIEHVTGILDALVDFADNALSTDVEGTESGPETLTDPGLPTLGDRVRLRESYPEDDLSGARAGTMASHVVLGVCDVAFDDGTLKKIPVRYLVKEELKGASTDVPRTVDSHLDDALSWDAPQQERNYAPIDQPAEDDVFLVVQEEDDEGADWYAEDRVTRAEETTKQLSEQHQLFVRHVRQAAGVKASEHLSEGQLVARVREQRAQLEALLKRLGAPDGSQIVTAVLALESLQNSAQSMAKEVADLQRENKMLRRREGTR